MRLREHLAIALTIVALVLLLAQALVWTHFTHRAHSETDRANLASEAPPTEIPGVAGFTLLFVAGVMVSVPRTENLE